MAKSADRLKRLVRLQRQIKALHETKHATYLSRAAAAGQEADELVESLNAASPVPGLFPDLYNRRIAGAMERQQRETLHAEAEAKRVATARARTDIVERAWREAAQGEARQSEDKERLEIVERGLTDRK